MSPKKLPPAAETIRCRIKDLIPDLSGEKTENSATVARKEEGGWSYEGDALTKQVALLSKELISSNLKVCLPAFLLTDAGCEIGLLNIGLGLGRDILSAPKACGNGKGRVFYSSLR